MALMSFETFLCVCLCVIVRSAFEIEILNYYSRRLFHFFILLKCVTLIRKCFLSMSHEKLAPLLCNWFSNKN